MHKDTLRGTKLKVYVLLKILKYSTGSPAKSYQMKFAVDRVFFNKEPASDKIGAAIREVINFHNIRGMFSSVHEDLARLGVTRIVIGDSGLVFEGDHCVSYHLCSNTWYYWEYSGSENTQEILRAIDMSLGQEDYEEDEEDEMLRRAMDMSLEQEEE